MFVDDGLYRELCAKAMGHLMSIPSPVPPAEQAHTALGAGHAWSMLALAEAIRLDIASRD